MFLGSRFATWSIWNVERADYEGNDLLQNGLLRLRGSITRCENLKELPRQRETPHGNHWLPWKSYHGFWSKVHLDFLRSRSFYGLIDQSLYFRTHDLIPLWIHTSRKCTADRLYRGWEALVAASMSVPVCFTNAESHLQQRKAVVGRRTKFRSRELRV